MEQLKLVVNLCKTKTTKFRRGSRTMAANTLCLIGLPLAYVNRFPYLGSLISVNGRSFTAHVSDRCRKAVRLHKRAKCGSCIRFDLDYVRTSRIALCGRKLSNQNRLKARFFKFYKPHLLSHLLLALTYRWRVRSLNEGSMDSGRKFFGKQATILYRCVIVLRRHYKQDTHIIAPKGDMFSRILPNGSHVGYSYLKNLFP